MTDTSIFKTLDGELDRLRDLYKDFHRHPELSGQEHRTAERIEAELESLGLQAQRIGGTGVVAVIYNGVGPTVLARADIDGLPVAEGTGLDYTSEVEGVMHACGHDMHIVGLLGAVSALTQNRDAWSGTYIAVFQPAEETAAGAQAMVDDGLTAKIPSPDVALALHVMPNEAGAIGTTAGPVFSAGDSIRITVYGRGSHGSMPHNGIDPIVLASSIVVRLQTIVSRETKPGEFAVVTVGALHAGFKSNILPDQAELLVNIRTYNSALRGRITSSIERIVRGECEAAGSPRAPEFHYYDQFPMTTNDAEVNAKVTAAFAEHFGAEAVHQAPPLTASEDFSRIPDPFGTPYTYWTVGSIPSQDYQKALENDTLDEDIPANHSPFFAPTIEPTLPTAAQTHLVAALAYLDTQAGT